MAQSLFVSLLPFSGCVNHRRGATGVKIPSAASSFSSGIFERCNKILVDDLHQTKPFNIIQEHRTKPFSLILPRNTDSKPRELGSGFILWKNYISLSDQVEIVNICQEFGVGPGGFYQPCFRDGSRCRFHFMCFGSNWDQVTGFLTGRVDGFQAPPIPDKIILVAEAAVRDSRTHLNPSHEIRSVYPKLCKVQFFTPTGRLALHQEVDQPSHVPSRPRISISIGDSAKFLYGRTRDLNKADEVLLESGDVLVFGGKSRHIYLGVKRIIPNSAPLPLLEHSMLRPGQLNLILR